MKNDIDEEKPTEVSEMKPVEGENQKRRNLRRGLFIVVGVIAVLVVVLAALYQVPAIHDRAYYYVTSLRSEIYYFFRPPEKSEFDFSG